MSLRRRPGRGTGHASGSSATGDGDGEEGESSKVWDLLTWGAGKGFTGKLPPVASEVAAHLGPTGCARLGLCGLRWVCVMPTGLCGSPRQHWAREHWPRPASELLPGGQWPTGVAGVSNLVDEAWLLAVQEPGLLVQHDAWGMTPLHTAAKRRCLRLCRLLLTERASVDAANSRDGWTPLHCAAAAGDGGCVRELLEARADPERQDEVRRLPLELAVRSRSEEAQEELLSRMGNGDGNVRAVNQDSCSLL